jgi:putative ABC transport system ATP-binding protein
MAEEIILEASGLCKTHACRDVRVEAVRSLSLAIARREIVCLFGRSGSGKTTLLNLLGGLDRPTSGQILFMGRDMAQIPPGQMPRFRRKNIGFVFQNFNLIPYLTALENVALPLRLDGVKRAERNERAARILTRLGLGDRLHFNCPGLSGGQSQRVAFARAAVAGPALILADEPTGHLDTASARDLALCIQELNQADGLTFLIATHDPALARVSHRILHMEDGSLAGEEPRENG